MSSDAVYEGVPTFFKAACWESQHSPDGYQHAGSSFWGSIDRLTPFGASDEEWQTEIEDAGRMLEAGDSRGFEQWFKTRFPHCCRFVPKKRRESFFRGAQRCHQRRSQAAKELSAKHAQPVSTNSQLFSSFATSRKRKGIVPVIATAYHEAGHAIVLTFKEFPVERVSIVPADHFHGVCVHPSVYAFSVNTARERRQLVRDGMIAAYAGLPAARLVCPTVPDWTAEQDLDDAMQLSIDHNVLPRSCVYMGDKAHLKYLARLQREARQLVHRFQLAIKLFAEQLLERHDLSGPELAQLLKSLVPSH